MPFRRTPGNPVVVTFAALLLALTVPSMAADAPVAPSAPSAPSAQPALAARAAARRAGEELRGGDRAGFLAGMREAVALAPTHPGLRYNLACAEALNAQPAEAVANLGRLAAAGLVFDVEADSDLATLRQRPDFAAVVATMRENLAPRVASQERLRLTDRELLVEGIALDPKTGTLFLSSVHRGTILRVAADGVPRELVPAGRDGLASPLGLAFDAPSNRLWACSSGLPQRLGSSPESLGRGALHAFDATTGASAGRWPIAGGETGHGCNDLALVGDGSVLVADADGGALLRLRAGAGALETVVPAGTFLSPQGIAVAADGRSAHVVDYSQGLFRVDLATGAVTAVTAPPEVALLGIDGLARHGESLLAIQNGVRPARVLRLRLSTAGDRVETAEVLERSHPAYHEPTLGVVAGDRLLYVAASGWPAFANGATADPAALRDPVVLALPLQP